MQQPKTKGVTVTRSNYLRLYRTAQDFQRIITRARERIIKPSATEGRTRSFIISGNMCITTGDVNITGGIICGDTRYMIHSAKFSLNVSASSNQDGSSVTVELFPANQDAAFILTHAHNLQCPPCWTLSFLDGDDSASFSDWVKSELLTDAENKPIIQGGREQPNDAEANVIITKLFDWFARQPCPAPIPGKP